MLADISLALSSLKMISTHKGKLVVLTPDDIYSRYIEFLPLLVPNTMTWLLKLREMSEMEQNHILNTFGFFMISDNKQ